VTQLKQLLIKEPPKVIVPKILDKGIMIRLVELFNKPTGLVSSKLKFEIAWVFTNMTMGNKEEVKRLVT
jgi:hypothetical protein